MTDATTRVGSMFGPYEIRALLGRGGMGEVYEAYDTVKGRVVALKILAEQHSADEIYRERFRREAHAAAKLEEPHVIPIHDWGDVDGTLYIDMRRVDGVDLRGLIKNGPLEPRRAVAVVSQIASALDAAHAAGLIHRDVKPENILITPGDFAYLVDFGIAESAGETHLTTFGSAVGSFAYMAPERFGVDDISPAADVYSLACVLHEALTGAAPYPSTSLQQVLAAHTSAPPPRPSLINPAVPASLDEVIARGMAKEPDDRYGSAGALARAAQRALAGVPAQPTAPLDVHSAATTVAAAEVPISYYQPSPPQPIPQPVPQPVPAAAPAAAPGSRNWVLPTVIATAVVLVAAALVGVLLLATTGRNTAQPNTKTVTAEVTASAAQSTAASTSQAAPTAATLPASARPCPTQFPPAGDYTKSAVGSDVTSCEFAENVRVAYGQSGSPSPTARQVNVWSPVTNQWYPMSCIANGSIATCTGGNDAVVYVY